MKNQNGIVTLETPKLVTVYYQGGLGMGMNKMEGKLLEFGTIEYAQYNNAATLSIIPKRKRKARQFIQSFEPSFLILEGVGHPDPGSAFEKVHTLTLGVSVKRSKYACFDERYISEFDVNIDSYLKDESVNVIADFRKVSGFSSYTGFPNAKNETAYA